MITNLAIKMEALANSGHPRAIELIEKALAFDEAHKNYTDAKSYLGAWARARKCWSECNGESLV